MFDRLFNQSAAPVLERSAAFYGARHALLAENIVNLSTPGYRQKDLDEAGFRAELRRRMDRRRADGTGAAFEAVEPEDTLVFHDGNNRNVEQLMSDQAKNALQHNLAVELLRKQYALFDLALRERLA